MNQGAQDFLYHVLALLAIKLCGLDTEKLQTGFLFGTPVVFTMTLAIFLYLELRIYGSLHALLDKLQTGLLFGSSVIFVIFLATAWILDQVVSKQVVVALPGGTVLALTVILCLISLAAYSFYQRFLALNALAHVAFHVGGSFFLGGMFLYASLHQSNKQLFLAAAVWFLGAEVFFTYTLIYKKGYQNILGGERAGGGRPLPRQHRRARQREAAPQRHANNNSNGPPPAKPYLLEVLPRIIVNEQDVATHEECAICKQDLEVNRPVLRLPCAHLYHEDCIEDWLLNLNCSCPMCMWEFPTDNAAFEQGRKQRMKDRKPRYYRYEVDRTPVRELKRCLPVGDTYIATEKMDLFQHLIDINAIEEVVVDVDADDAATSEEQHKQPPAIPYTREHLMGLPMRELRNLLPTNDPFIPFEKRDLVEHLIEAMELDWVLT